LLKQSIAMSAFIPMNFQVFMQQMQTLDTLLFCFMNGAATWQLGPTSLAPQPG
jgi:hypothetical protein